MGQDEITTEPRPSTSDRGRDASHTTGSQALLSTGSRAAEPFFKRFGVSKDWRAKDSGVG